MGPGSTPGHKTRPAAGRWAVCTERHQNTSLPNTSKIGRDGGSTVRRTSISIFLIRCGFFAKHRTRRSPFSGGTSRKFGEDVTVFCSHTLSHASDPSGSTADKGLHAQGFMHLNIEIYHSRDVMPPESLTLHVY